MWTNGAFLVKRWVGACVQLVSISKFQRQGQELQSNFVALSLVAVVHCEHVKGSMRAGKIGT